MDDQTRGNLTEKIKENIAKFEAEVAQLEEYTQPIGPENAIGRVSRMDAINNKSVLEASLRSKRDKLEKLRIALKRVHEKNFGICTDCKRPILPARLMFMPESDRCVRCADRN